LSAEEPMWAIPKHHIVWTSTLDMADKALLNQAFAEGHLWHIDIDHDLMIPDPRK
jgi:hypothetical protein